MEDNNVKTVVAPNVGDAIVNNYLLAKLQVSVWSGKKTDKTATRELLADKGAVANAAAVVKNLLAGNDAKLKEAGAAYTRIRTWFYDRTVPWTTSSVGAMKGDRLIATADSINLFGEFAKLKKQAEDAKLEFLNEYEQAVNDVAQSLGGLYDASQYPHKSQISTMFGAELSVVPLPEATDFSRLTNVPAKLVTGLQDLYKRNMEVQMNNALSDVQGRLLSELKRMDTQLSKVAKGEKTRLFKSMVTNLKQLVGMARSVNFVDNAEIAAIADGIEKHLLAYEVDAYRDNATLAGSSAKMARKLAGLVENDEVWSVNNTSDVSNIDDDGSQEITATPQESTEAVSSVDDEPAPSVSPQVEEDQKFLASLLSDDDEEDEPTQETPDFDDDDFMFSV